MDWDTQYICLDDTYGFDGLRIYDKGVVPALRHSRQGLKVAKEVTIDIREATKKGYASAREGRDAINLAVPGSQTRRGRIGRDLANTLDTGCNQGIAKTTQSEDEHPGMYVPMGEDCVGYAVWYPKKQCYVTIRKLTPKECFRLQGWTDDYFEKAQFVNSDSQLYKQAGNGVTVNVVEAIGRKIAEATFENNTN